MDDLRERTTEFALRIIRLVSSLPTTVVAEVIGKQVLRSGTSVGANYREAYRARSDAEFIAKLGDCLKELEETAYWFELLAASGVVAPPRLEALRDETHQRTAIFTTIAKRRKNAIKRQSDLDNDT